MRSLITAEDGWTAPHDPPHASHMPWNPSHGVRSCLSRTTLLLHTATATWISDKTLQGQLAERSKHRSNQHDYIWSSGKIPIEPILQPIRPHVSKTPLISCLCNVKTHKILSLMEAYLLPQQHAHLSKSEFGILNLSSIICFQNSHITNTINVWNI